MELLAAPALHWASALVLAGIFLPSAWSKLRAIDEVIGVVADYRILPEPLVEPFARALPWLEIATGLLLLLPPTRPFGAVLGAGLLLVFAVAMAVNLARGRREIDCGCFLGRQKERIGWPLVARNLLLASAAALLLVEPAALLPRPAELVPVLFGSAALLALYAAFSRLAGLAPIPRAHAGRRTQTRPRAHGGR
ncbi:MAG: methylamine utilization protein MauE [Geminicoccaceae bacterium]|nr:methylamine utilization protein MauE [Geminicoccaceae bacterium]